MMDSIEYIEIHYASLPLFTSLNLSFFLFVELDFITAASSKFYRDFYNIICMNKYNPIINGFKRLACFKIIEGPKKCKS